MDDVEDLLVSPAVSISNTSVEGAAALANVDSSRKSRLPSDTSTRTVWSGRVEGEGHVSPLSTLAEGDEANMSRESIISASSHLSQRCSQPLPRGALEPFYVDNELKVLEASYADFESALQAVANVIAPDDSAYGHLLVKDDHYGTVFDQLQTAVKDRIVYLCQMKQLPFPGSPSRWSSRRKIVLHNFRGGGRIGEK